jgi:hypothetical protein
MDRNGAFDLTSDGDDDIDNSGNSGCNEGRIIDAAQTKDTSVEDDADVVELVAVVANPNAPPVAPVPATLSPGPVPGGDRDSRRALARERRESRGDASRGGVEVVDVEALHDSGALAATAAAPKYYPPQYSTPGTKVGALPAYGLLSAQQGQGQGQGQGLMPGLGGLLHRPVYTGTGALAAPLGAGPGLGFAPPSIGTYALPPGTAPAPAPAAGPGVMSTAPRPYMPPYASVPVRPAFLSFSLLNRTEFVVEADDILSPQNHKVNY